MTTISTYSQFSQLSASEKIGLVILEAAIRAIGWQLHTGSIYKLIEFEPQVLTEIAEEGVILSLGSNPLLLNQGEYYHDRVNQILYVRCTDSSNPNGKFISVVFKNFFSTPNGLITLPHDFASGFEVPFLPYVQDTSDFGVELDNANQLGVAIEGSGSVKLINDQAYWHSRWDKLSFENQKVEVRSWSRLIPASESRVLFRGYIQKRTYGPQSISFALKDSLNALRAPVPLSNMIDYPGARLTNALKTAKQRVVYGHVYGHRPTNIDAVLTGYPLTGTVSVTNGSDTILGTGTSFLAQVSPEDELLFISPVGQTSYSVLSVSDDVNIQLNSAYTGSTANGIAVYIKPKETKRYMNRQFVVAAHSLREPTPTVTVELSSVNRLLVTSVTDLTAGDEILVGTELSAIQRISGNEIKLTTNLLAPAPVGTVVTRTAITNVYLGERPLIVTRDYTYSALNGTLTLDPLAEFNIAPILSIAGSITFTNTSRTVSATSGQFKTQLKAGDWIKADGQFDYFEILTIIDDNLLVLRTPATYSVTGSAKAKKPKYYIEDNAETILTCDVLGKTTTGLPSGNLLSTVPEIIKDLLNISAVTDIDTASFDDAILLAPQEVGLVVPKKFNDRNTPKLKDVINELNKSVFGSLIQNNDFLLSYHVLRPKRTTSIVRYVESDILNFNVQSASDKIAKQVRLRYQAHEYEPVSRAITFEESVSINKNAQYLSKTANELVVETNLINEDDARIASNRWAFLVGVATNVITFRTKLQTADLNINDPIEFQHEKLFERVGSFANRKIAAVQSAKKSVNDCTIEVEDLSNAFSRCAIITENGLPNYDDSSDEERFYRSFITDTYGMQNNDPDTFGVNLIW